MENKVTDYSYQNVIQLDDTTASRKFIAKVFAWMFVALGISSAFAWVFANTPSLIGALINPATGGQSGLGFLVMLSPLAFVLVMSFGFNRLSYAALAVIYVLYAAVMGISLSYILLIYTSQSIFGVFITASLLFGVMALAGYFTNTDLTKFGSLMIMLLIGIIIASVVNLFLHSTGLYMLISYIGVAVFVGLTAYDVQKLKRIGAGIEYGEAPAAKMALMGGLNLYLDFVNLFIYLLRIFGRRR